MKAKILINPLRCLQILYQPPQGRAGKLPLESGATPTANAQSGEPRFTPRSRRNVMGVALIGCGSVAPFYLKTLSRYRQMELIGVMDQDEQRATRFSRYYSVPRYHSIHDVLKDRRVKLVLNLTNPRSHFEVSKACLLAGKHVYSEKPLVTSFSEAKELARLAKEKNLCLSAAPSRLLGETAQTLWKLLRDKEIGTVHLVYAEMDGGLVHRMRYKEWINELGIPWPYKDEFEVGYTLEHAAYPLTWLLAFFGPVQTVTAFSSCQIPDKGLGIPGEGNVPDFSVAILKFVSGLVARLTFSCIAPMNRSLRIFGDKGVLCTNDITRPRCPVYVEQYITIGSRTMIAPWKKRYPLVCPPPIPNHAQARRLINVFPPRSLFRGLRARARHLRNRYDFCLGIVELEASIREGRPSRLSAQFCLHTTEVTLAIHKVFQTGSAYKVETSFDPIDPMPWAKP